MGRVLPFQWKDSRIYAPILNMSSRCELVLALDNPNQESMEKLLDQVGQEVKWVKIGLTLFCRYGPNLVREVATRGYKIFLDLKLYDIPHQVAGTVRSLVSLPVDLLTIHASGGSPMMKEAVQARDEAQSQLKLLGVTVLTSFNNDTLAATGMTDTMETQVERLAQLGIHSGMDGLVCSPLELELLRNSLGSSPILLTPGIRPKGSAAGDQQRILTPREAAQKGSSFIVVGRPITAAEDPAQAAAAIQSELR